MKNLLHGPIAQWALKWGIGHPKLGAAISFVAAQIAAHVVTWLGLSLFLDAEAIKAIQGGIEQGAISIGLALQAAAYAKLVQWQKQGVEAMQVAINQSENNPVTVKVDGAAGNETIKAAAKIADVPVQDVVAEVKRGVPVDPVQ